MIAGIPMRRSFAFLAAIVFASAALAREPAPLPGAEGRVSLGAHVEVLEDAERRLRLGDVRRAQHAACFPSGYRIEFFLPEPQPGGEPRYWVRIAGDQFPWAAREVQHRNFLFRFAAPTAPGPHQYYLRVDARG